MQSILDAINEWIKEILIGTINGNLSTMFGDVNEKVGTIAAEVGQTPQGWNASIFSMIQTLSENVIIPLAGLVITYVLCVELISMVTEKNNMHDVDTFMFFKWFFKAWVAVYLVTHTFDITMAVFDVAQRVVSGAAGVISGNTNIDVTAALSSMQDGLNDMEIPELLLLDLYCSFASVHAIAPFHSEGLGHFPTSNFQPTRRSAGGRKYGKGYSFPMLAMKVLSLVYLLQQEVPFLPKESKEKPCNSSLSVCFQYYIDNNVSVVYNVYVVTSH